MLIMKLANMLPSIPVSPALKTTGCSPSGIRRVANQVIGTSMNAMTANTAA